MNSIQQASRILDEAYIVPLTKDEARQMADDIGKHIDDAYALVVELHDREGWKALGYTSWTDCCVSEFQFSRQRGYQLLQAARVKKNLSSLPSKAGEVSTNGRHLPNERQARELGKLDTAQEQREAYDEALRRSNGNPTAAVVERVVKPRRVEAVFRQGEVVLHIPTGLRCTVASVLPDGAYRLKPTVSNAVTRSMDWSLPVALDDIAMGKAGVAVNVPRPALPITLRRNINAEYVESPRERCMRLLENAPDAVLESVLHLLESSVEGVA